jgi:hypothetical protein
MARKIWVVLFLFSLIFALASCGGSKVSGTEGGVCSRYNLHYVAEKGVEFDANGKVVSK